MAKQDFVNGGFFGKLGQMIGQRQKAGYIVKAYAKPANPRTAKQQANRQKFVRAVNITNLANQCNCGADIWKGGTKTPYNWRMSQAKAKLDNGIEEVFAMPLYPDGTTPAAIINDLVAVSDGTNITLTSAVVLGLSASRKFHLQAYVYNSTTQAMEWHLYDSITSVGSSTLAVLDQSDIYKWTSASYVTGITYDDNAHNGDFVYVYPQTPEPIDVTYVDVTWASQYNENANGAFSVDLSEIAGNYTLVVVGQIVSAVDGKKSQKSQTYNLTGGTKNNCVFNLDTYETLYGGCTMSYAFAPQAGATKNLAANPDVIALGQKRLSLAPATPFYAWQPDGTINFTGDRITGESFNYTTQEWACLFTYNAKEYDGMAQGAISVVADTTTGKITGANIKDNQGTDVVAKFTGVFLKDFTVSTTQANQYLSLDISSLIDGAYSPEVIDSYTITAIRETENTQSGTVTNFVITFEATESSALYLEENQVNWSLKTIDFAGNSTERTGTKSISPAGIVYTAKVAGDIPEIVDVTKSFTIQNSKNAKIYLWACNDVGTSGNSIATAQTPTLTPSARFTAWSDPLSVVYSLGLPFTPRADLLYIPYTLDFKYSETTIGQVSPSSDNSTDNQTVGVSVSLGDTQRAITVEALGIGSSSETIMLVGTDMYNNKVEIGGFNIAVPSVTLTQS